LNNPHKASGLSVGIGGVSSYADQIAQKYKDNLRGMSAQHRPRGAMNRKLGAGVSGISLGGKGNELKRRKTAQPNQR
jgi:hypothetical protein